MTKLDNHCKNWVGACVASLVLLPAAQARAADATGVPDIVEVLDTVAWKYVHIRIGATSYVAKFGGTAGDPCLLDISADSAKSMQSLTSTALLAGRSVKLHYNHCSTDRLDYVYAVELIR
jgi:hypothetical protein